MNEIAISEDRFPAGSLADALEACPFPGQFELRAFDASRGISGRFNRPAQFKLSALLEDWNELAFSCLAGGFPNPFPC